MRWVRLAIAVVLAASFSVAARAAPAAAPATSTVAYTLSPQLDAAGLTALDVTLTFVAGPGRHPLRLDLPDSAGGASGLWRYLTDLKVVGADKVTDDGPAARLIAARSGARITVSYRVISAVDHDPGPPDLDTYKPTIRPRWFWAYGEALFARPEGYDRASFAWTGAPAGFPFASDLEDGAGRPVNIDHLIESVSVGGPDLAVTRRDIGGAPVRVAIVGRYGGFDGPTFADIATRIIAGERAFWRTPEGPFLVVLAPLTPAPHTRDARGEGRTNAFAIMTSSDMTLAYLRGLLGHEYFHTWNPARLGGMPDGAHEPSAYWFSEGYTDFYARRLLLRMGVFSLDDFVAAWNDVLRAYANSPVREAPVARVEADFWEDQNVQQLSYQRGAILAAMADARLRAVGRKGGLDGVMRAMLVAARRPHAPLSPALFLATVKAAGVDMSPDARRIAVDGAPALLPPDAFGACIHVDTKDAPMFDLGFNWPAARQSHSITDVEPSSAAYAAGLRDGMTLVRIDVQLGDTSRPIKLSVSDGAGTRDITYLPAGRTVRVQQLSIPANLSAAERARCAAEATGG